MKRAVFHGEVALFEVKEIPKGLKRIEVKDDFFVIGESETHGNDHRVAVKDKLQVRFYEDEHGTLYMENLCKTDVYCPNKTRHATTTIPETRWRIGHAQQVDHLTEQKERVRD